MSELLKDLSSQVKSSWAGVPSVYKYAVYIIVCVFVLSILSKLFENDYVAPEVQEQVKELIQSASRMHAISSQDTNPIVAYKHINYALANARTAQRYIRNDDALFKLTQIHVPEFIRVLEQAQTDTLKQICQTCPMMKPTTMFAGSSGWL